MNVLIVDADAPSAHSLRDMIGEIADDEVRCVSTSTELNEAFFDIEENVLYPDICFIDLSPAQPGRPAWDGIRLAAKLLKVASTTQIIFISAYDTFYLDSYEVYHIYFLQKPVEREFLLKAWDRAMENLNKWENRLFRFSFNRRNYQIHLRDILYFEKDLRKVIVHTRNPEQEYTFYGTINSVLAQLDEHFLRCHNSYIVNLLYIDGWTKNSFAIGRHKIPISRQYEKAARAVFIETPRGVVLRIKR